MQGGSSDEGFFNDPGLAFADRGRSKLTPRSELKPADSTRRVFSILEERGSGPSPTCWWSLGRALGWFVIRISRPRLGVLSNPLRRVVLGEETLDYFRFAIGP
jgi:hypothetical protein